MQKIDGYANKVIFSHGITDKRTENRLIREVEKRHGLKFFDKVILSVDSVDYVFERR